MTLFRLGRLQFELQPGPLDKVWASAPIPEDALVLHVHIPKGADLSPAAVRAAYQYTLLEC